MFNFISRPVSSEAIQSNKEIKERFLQLNASQKKQLIKWIPANERKALINIIGNTSQANISKSTLKRLKIRVLYANNLSIDITRPSDKRTFLERFKNWLLNQLINISAEKANLLIKEILFKELVKENKERSISSQKLNQLLKQARSNSEKINLAKLLEENGFSKNIRNQTFSEGFSFKNIDLENITFINCSFDWTPCSNSKLKNVRFKGCDIYNLSLINSELENCLFDNCETREIMFSGAKLKDVNFYCSSLICASFEDSSITNCMFLKSALPATHFLESDVKNCSLKDTNLKDTIFCGTFDKFEVDEQSKKTAHVTRPTTAILINPESRGIATPKAFIKLDHSADTIPIRINMVVQNVTKEEVNKEVEAALAKVGAYDKNKAPIPQRLMAELATNPYSESSRILKKAEKLATHVDSIFLPGGEDVPPSLYGQKKGEQTEWGDDYRRSILELGLIHQSFTKGVPLMAVCRGFQMSNVYFGAQLIQHIGGQNGVQKIELSTLAKASLYAEAMKNNIISVSYHHQAISEEFPATEHLEIAVRYQGVVKATELNKSGAIPMILIQFHPEFYNVETADSLYRDIVDVGLNLKISEQNEVFWRILSTSAKAYRIKRIVLRQIPKIALYDGNSLVTREVKLVKLEDDQVKVFNAYKKSLNWKKALLKTVEKEPEKLLFRYLASTNSFFEERKTLEAALKNNTNFLKSLMIKKNRESILKVIQEVNPLLYEELEQGPLQPYLSETIK